MKLPLVPSAVTHIPADVRQDATGLSASGGAGWSGLDGRTAGEGEHARTLEAHELGRTRRVAIISTASKTCVLSF